MALRDSITQLVKKLLYFSFLAVGMYWVYVGDAIDKYLTEKTGFTETAVAINQLPTIITYIDHQKESQYGDDFNISYSVYHKSHGLLFPINLTFGENIIPGYNLKILFEETDWTRGSNTN